MNMLARALAIAALAFQDKTDKAGKPYMLHLLRVMDNLNSNDDELNCIAILHDLMEDCPEWTPEKLFMEGLQTSRVINALVLLTHEKGTEYMDYIKALSFNRDAVAVKLADLKDNSDITRLKGLTKKDFERMEKYHTAYTYLSKI